jgi:parvulin-like peptidyl-prolyl isomerase
LSPVLKTELGYEVFQVLERTPLSEEEIEAFLANPRVLVQREKMQAHLDQVYREHGVSVDEAAAARLATDPGLPPDTVLGKVGEWKLTARFVRGYVGGIKNPKQRPPLATPEQARKLCADLLGQKALRLAMEERGFFGEPGNRGKVDAYLDKALSEFYLDRIMAGIELTDADRSAHFRARSGGVMLPPKVHLRLIVVDEEERARRIHAQLGAGKDWETLAGAYSIDSSATAGGDLGWVPITQINPSYQRVVDRLAVGAYSEPFEAGGRYVLLRLDGREGERLATEAEALPLLEQQALREKSEKHYKDYMKKLRQTYPVKIFAEVVKKAQRPPRAQKPAGAPSRH